MHIRLPQGYADVLESDASGILDVGDPWAEFGKDVHFGDARESSGLVFMGSEGEIFGGLCLGIASEILICSMLRRSMSGMVRRDVEGVLRERLKTR